jgi:septal ring factor EnvC (AmiA/AmiB activator)
MYVIITRFGDYIITYTGITNPSIVKGDFITKGQPIGVLQKDLDEKFRVSLYLNKGEDQIDPFNWFIHTSCPQ